MPKLFIINEGKIHDIPSFYKEINRLFISPENWRISESLDALNNLFYGDFSALKSVEKFDLEEYQINLI